jgi:hypothetical protein
MTTRRLTPHTLRTRRTGAPRTVIRRTGARRTGIRRSGTRLTAGLACACLLLPFLLTGCTSNPAPATMTVAQADHLALARFTEYQLGASTIQALVPISGQSFTITGRIDWRAHRALAVITPTNTPSAPASATQLLLWTPNWLAVHGTWKGPAPTTPPPDGWTPRPWQPGAELDTVLRLILDLAAARPENAQLLRQSGAIALRTDTVGTRPVTVYQGPPSADGTGSHTRYWIADDNTLLRFEARAGTDPDWARIDIKPGPAKPVPPIPGTPPES